MTWRRVKRAGVWLALIVSVGWLVYSIVAQDWWAAAFLTFGSLGWTLNLFWDMEAWVARRQAFLASELLAETGRAIRVLHAQGEDRLEVREQTQWIAEGLRSRQTELRAVAAEGRMTDPEEFKQLFEGVLLDLLPVLEQHAVDYPSKVNRRVLRRTRQRVLRRRRWW